MYGYNLPRQYCEMRRHVSAAKPDKQPDLQLRTESIAQATLIAAPFPPNHPTSRFPAVCLSRSIRVPGYGKYSRQDQSFRQVRVQEADAVTLRGWFYLTLAAIPTQVAHQSCNEQDSRSWRGASRPFSSCISSSMFGLDYGTADRCMDSSASTKCCWLNSPEVRNQRSENTYSLRDVSIWWISWHRH